jgi:hypothetical protein
VQVVEASVQATQLRRLNRQVVLAAAAAETTALQTNSQLLVALVHKTLTVVLEGITELVVEAVVLEQ